MTCARNHKEPACKGVDKKNTASGVHRTHTGLLHGFKGRTRTCGYVHGTDRCKRDSMSFLHRQKPHSNSCHCCTTSIIKVHRKWGLQSPRTCHKVSDDTSLQISDRFSAEYQVMKDDSIPDEADMPERTASLWVFAELSFNIWSIKDVSPDFKTGR